MRTLHYYRMPSRDIPLKSCSRRGKLKRDIVLEGIFKSTAFHTSAVQLLLVVPKEKIFLFEHIRESVERGFSAISVVSRDMPVDGD